LYPQNSAGFYFTSCKIMCLTNTLSTTANSWAIIPQ
jgi:hypothetical protein